MKNTVLTFILFLCVLSSSILRGQTPAPATIKTVEKEVKITKTKASGAAKTTKTTTTTSAKPATAKKTAKTGAKKTTRKVEKVIVKTNDEVVSIQPETTKAGEMTNTPKATTNNPTSITGIPVMTFDKKLYDFGNIKMGEMPSITYTFTNTGNAPLDIDIVTGCECTELDWTRTTVAPGEKGFISAKYNSNKAEEEDHKKQLEKYVDIILKQTHPSNGYPLVESLKFKVFIVD
ncbi:MAG: DUF1573 domain-containing protein [Saprospiraceae bacterium]|nr:DUF1573 domain-containing protein [Saprospiraceae bacterium]